MDLSDRAMKARVSRRHLMLGTAAAAAAAGMAPLRWARAADDRTAAAKSSHFPFGPVVPARPIAPWQIVTHTGKTGKLNTLLEGRISAVQLMFTGCSATCPIQGAVFAQAQRLLSETKPAAGAGAAPAVQFVSLTIDPLGDDPRRLSAWLRGFDAAPNWWAGAPRIEDVDKLIGLLGRGGEPQPVGNDPHTGQVFIVNSRSELVHRTIGMAPAKTIVEALRMVASGRA